MNVPNRRFRFPVPPDKETEKCDWFVAETREDCRGQSKNNIRQGTGGIVPFKKVFDPAERLFPSAAVLRGGIGPFFKNNMLNRERRELLAPHTRNTVRFLCHFLLDQQKEVESVSKIFF